MQIINAAHAVQGAIKEKMKIIFTRIDNRLLHGQVVQSWLPQIDAREVVIVSQEAASSGIMQKMMRLALPSSYALHIFDGEQAAKYLSGQGTQKVFLLVDSFEALASLVKEGIKFENVNVGNTMYEEGKKEYSQGVYLADAETALAKDLAKTIKFDVRALPTSLSKRLF